MTISELGSIGEIVGSIGVILSLIYLASQIRQNTRQLMRAEMNATHDQFTNWRDKIIESSEFADLWVEALSGSELSRSEKTRFELSLQEVFWASYHYWDRGRVGILGDNWQENALGGITDLLGSSPVVRSWWDQNKKTFEEEFRRSVDERAA